MKVKKYSIKRFGHGFHKTDFGRKWETFSKKEAESEMNYLKGTHTAFNGQIVEEEAEVDGPYLVKPIESWNVNGEVVTFLGCDENDNFTYSCTCGSKEGRCVHIKAVENSFATLGHQAEMCPGGNVYPEIWAEFCPIGEEK